MMNEASQQSKNLDELISELKQLWRVEPQNHHVDEQAKQLVCAFLNTHAGDSDTISVEEFTIQKKVLAKTREKTEALQNQLETLEAKLL